MSKHQHSELKAAIDRCMIADRFRFNKLLHARNRRASLAAQIEQSAALATTRLARLPKVEFPEQLPVSARVDDISDAIARHQVVIVAGETGSGKTTQIPKICLQLGRGVYGRIGHTQPRRVAARTVSSRIAEELGVSLGQEVGYQVRFSDQSSDMTLVKVMTDGILLAETQQDRFLEAYDTIIIDEAHERSLNIDFLLGYLKRILPKRPDLKVIVTSATIDVDRFSAHFNRAPVIEVSGRTYPVSVEYRPPEASSKTEDADQRVTDAIVDVLDEIAGLDRKAGSPGDVLIFLPGEREIRDVAQWIRRSALSGVEILPLYSRLSIAEQNRVFQTGGRSARRVVLATNVAETSLTVPGIRYVIDPGLARISRYSVRSKVQQLQIEPVSQASAEQRKGRCGRTGPGVCFRLYSEDDFQARSEFTLPEIKRTNLASVILQMLVLRLGDISKFPFVERPEQRQINDGFQLLNELQAVTESRAVTRLGRDMARIPVDIQLARMLIEAGRTGCLDEVLKVVSAMVIQDPRERPHNHQQAADERHRRHWHERSDFIGLVNLWGFYEEHRQSLSTNQQRKFCRENFLSYLRMREWRENHRQLQLICKDIGLKMNRTPGDYDSIHRAILSGLIGNVGERTEKNEYVGVRNRRHFIFPASSQFKRKPKWIVSAELVETSRLFARTVAEIDSAWIEPLAAHLVKRHYHEPRFEKKSGQVVADEEVMLYGLSIVRRRRVGFGSIDPVRARQLFIQHGLAERQLNSSAPFFVQNERLIAEVERLESKSRRRDLLVDAYTLYRFYDERIPAHVCSQVELDAWRRDAERNHPKLLFLQREDLIRQHANLPSTAFPDALDISGSRLKLDYQFNPEHEEDGVSVEIPVALLRQVSSDRIDFLIPGMLEEKCLALIKTLPKSVRKNFVPAPDFARRASEGLEFDGRGLREVLAEKLFRLSGVRVNPEDFRPDDIDRHLRMNIKVVDAGGKTLEISRDLPQLMMKFGEDADREFRQSVRHDIEVDGLTDWDFDDLPQSVDMKQRSINLRGYPALVDKGQSVSVEIMDDERDAGRLTRQGLVRLFMLQLNDQARYLQRKFPRYNEFAIYFATQADASSLPTDLVEASFRHTFVEELPLPRSREIYRERFAEKQYLMTRANELGDLLVHVMSAANRIEQLLAAARTDLNRYGCDDIERQLARMLAPGFIASTPRRWLLHLPRYLSAIEYRLERMRGNLARDRESTELVRSFEARVFADGDIDPSVDVVDFRWLLEEYRVSLFAQVLGTSQPVSAKRLERAWQDGNESSRRVGE